MSSCVGELYLICEGIGARREKIERIEKFERFIFENATKFFLKP
jgi:hypothetical protein